MFRNVSSEHERSFNAHTANQALLTSYLNFRLHPPLSCDFSGLILGVVSSLFSPDVGRNECLLRNLIFLLFCQASLFTSHEISPFFRERRWLLANSPFR